MSVSAAKMGIPQELVLLFDFGGVISTSPFPAIRQYTAMLIQGVFDRALAQGSGSVLNAPEEAQKGSYYSSLFFDILKYTAKARRVRHTSFDRLETGKINRLGFVKAYQSEFSAFMEALATAATPANNNSTTEAFFRQHGIDAKAAAPFMTKYQLLGTPTVLPLLSSVFDAENFLCIIEKVAIRKNVINLIHCLRITSHQEVKIGVVTNNWEPEGGYLRSQGTKDPNGEAAYLPISCPNEWDEERRNSFNASGLFDVVCESYLMEMRKPNPAMFKDAVQSFGGPAQNRHFYYFDDIKSNCDIAQRLVMAPQTPVGDLSTPQPAFSEVFCVSNGASDVLKGVLKALETVSQKDLRWKSVLETVNRAVVPLFAPLHARNGREIPWAQSEMLNADGNAIYLPIPSNPASYHGDHPNALTEYEINQLLFYLCRHCPQYFPIVPPRDKKLLDQAVLAEDPSLATSAGPIAVDYFKGGMSNPTYRITLRTGSFVIRKQPKGKLLKGAHNIRREYETLTHLRSSSKVPVPNCLHYCSDKSVLGTEFYVMRYLEGRILRDLSSLIRPSFNRSFSRSRVLNTKQISAKPYVFAAVRTLVELHNAPLPPKVAKKLAAKKDQGSGDVHPLMHLVNVWSKMYNMALDRIAEVDESVSKSLRNDNFEFLTTMLQSCFDGNLDDMPAPPHPPRMTLAHGDYKLDNMMFDYRSCEEQRVKSKDSTGQTTAKLVLKPEVVAVMDFELSNVGDPLTDVAYLTLMNEMPPPRGINGVTKATGLFPSTEEILTEYVEASGLLKEEDPDRRMQILRVYQAGMCHKLAGITHGVVVRATVGNASDVQGGLALKPLVSQLSATGIRLLGGEASSNPPAKL